MFQTLCRFNLYHGAFVLILVAEFATKAPLFGNIWQTFPAFERWYSTDAASCHYGVPGGHAIKAKNKKTKEFQLFSNINLAFYLALPHLVMLFLWQPYKIARMEESWCAVKSKAKRVNLRAVGEVLWGRGLNVLFQINRECVGARDKDRQALNGQSHQTTFFREAAD